MGLLSRLFAPKPDPRDAMRPLWNAIVAEARDPYWYAVGGVEDSVAGRFDMVAMITGVVLLRLERTDDLSRAGALLTECFVEDMDGQLREFGVGDMVVGKHVGRLIGSLGGRLGALRQALPRGEEAVREVVQRNVTLCEDAAPGRIAAKLVDLYSGLATTNDAAILAGALAASEAQ